MENRKTANNAMDVLHGSLKHSCVDAGQTRQEFALPRPAFFFFPCSGSLASSPKDRRGKPVD